MLPRISAISSGATTFRLELTVPRRRAVTVPSVPSVTVTSELTTETSMR